MTQHASQRGRVLRSVSRWITFCRAGLILLLSFVHPLPASADYYGKVVSGIAAIERGAYAAAVDAFIKAQRINPDDALARLGLGTAALFLGDTTTARTEFNAALQLDPHSSTAYNGLGICHIATHSLNDAIVAFGNAVRYDPLYTDARLHFAYAYCLEKKAELALEQIALARQSGASGDFLSFVHAMACSLTGEYEDAVQTLLPMRTSVKSHLPHGLLEAYPSLPTIVPSSATFIANGNSTSQERGDVAVSRGLQLAVLRECLGKGASVVDDHPEIVAREGDGGYEVSGITHLVASVDALVEGSRASPAEVLFVSFGVDGRTRCVVNTPPFAWDWNTTKDADGWHVVTMRAYSKAGFFIGEQKLRVRVRNKATSPPDEGTRTYTDAQEREGTDRIKSLLCLRTNALQTRYLLGRVYEATGRLELALDEFTRVFLSRHDYLDCRATIHDLRRRLGQSQSSREMVEIQGAECSEKLVALTFDDGPKPPYSERLLQLLREHEVRATFFIVGKMAEMYPEMVRAIAADGHELASHSYSHRHMTDLSNLGIEDEILRTELVLREITGTRVRYFRPPGGRYNTLVTEALANHGYQLILWGPNITSFSNMLPAVIAERLLRQTTPGCIILLHNGPDATLAVLPALLAVLKSRGYRPVTVTELLSAGKPIERRPFRNLTRHTGVAHHECRRK